jgi:thymidine phosphorylase
MESLRDAQGRQTFDFRAPPLAPRVQEIHSGADGLVTGIDNERLARVARLAGAPQCKGAGVDLGRKLGQAVKAGEVLYRIHAGNAAELEFARRLAAQASGYTIGNAVPPADPQAEF